MKKSMLFTALAVIGMGICCYGAASQGENDKPKTQTQDPVVGEIIVVEGVAFTDNCAKDPKSPCVKDGKCVCKDKLACKNCKAHLKKCDKAAQEKCKKLIKDGKCPKNGTCPKDAAKQIKKDAASLDRGSMFYVAQNTCPMNNAQKNSTAKDQKACPKDVKKQDGAKQTCPKDGKTKQTCPKDKQKSSGGMCNSTMM